MKSIYRTRKDRGFTMVELLVVMGMFALVLTAVYSIYMVQSDSSRAQDEVVEVQQNLRISMDEMTRDIKMAGILLQQDFTCAITAIPIPSIDATGINNNGGVGGTDILTLNMASASGRYARIDQDGLVSGSTTVFPVDSATAVDPFINPPATLKARIIRATKDGNREVVVGGLFSIAGTSRASVPPTISLSGLPAGVTFLNYDVIVGTTGATWPDKVMYCVGTQTSPNCPAATCPDNQQCLVRIENGAPSVVATNITDLQFRYLLTDGSETDMPGDLRMVRAIRVNISGQTVLQNATFGQTRTKQMESVIKTRNQPGPCSL